MRKIILHNLAIVIENPKGSYKSFETDGDPLWKEYPLKGVTYPVDYGYIEGYASEDGEDLDVFAGSGEANGYIKIWRCDTPIETKFILGVTQDEYDAIIRIFDPVITEKKIFKNYQEFTSMLEEYKK